MMHVTVNKWGNSLALRIPKSIAEGFGIQDGSSVEVRLSRGLKPKIILEPGVPTLEHLVAQITAENAYAIVDDDIPRGNEVW